ncbi:MULTISPECIES: NAD(P)H-dependent oxidoreductase [unclassified Thioalkalivibrio]|uniref:NAD(P)H-dependent oxidoreductase n=1 Tax=unclassified Thioalkalivibrio TaxID=2621013 RepID=UPI00037DF496|nr:MULTISPECIES: NAD(P)H-dependent oxidoreductase [unclassified Thioalkalivibrio]
MTRILILQGHPDPAEGHFDHALADAYREGAERAGLAVDAFPIAQRDFPLLRSQAEFLEEAVPPAILEAQELIEVANHLVLIYPLWMGDMPALVKGFLEQVFRPSFVGDDDMNQLRHTRLRGRSVRIVVTMGMPAPIYRWFYRAHSLKSLERNVFRFCGFGPVRHTLIGQSGGDAASRERWLARMRELGGQAK